MCLRCSGATAGDVEYPVMGHRCLAMTNQTSDRTDESGDFLEFNIKIRRPRDLSEMRVAVTDVMSALAVVLGPGHGIIMMASTRDDDGRERWVANQFGTQLTIRGLLERGYEIVMANLKDFEDGGPKDRRIPFLDMELPAKSR